MTPVTGYARFWRNAPVRQGLRLLARVALTCGLFAAVPGDGRAAEFQESVSKAENGDAGAQYEVGFAYANAVGVPQSYPQALQWYQKAAAQGNAPAQASLGFLYENGLGVKRDLAEAIKWYREAAGRGSAPVQYKLARLYETGVGGARNLAAAARWYRRAADQGFAPAQASLGALCAEGKGAPQDYAEAVKWWELAEKGGSSDGTMIRDLVVRQLPASQVAEGRRRAAAFVARAESGQLKLEDETPMAEDLPPPKIFGAGFFITDDGYLLTDARIVLGASRVLVACGKGRFTAAIIGVDRINGVALLKADGNFSALPLIESRAIKLGGTVYTAGFTEADAHAQASAQLNRGEVSGLAGPESDPREFQVKVARASGGSGGPILNDAGNVIGLLSGAKKQREESGGSVIEYALRGAYALGLVDSAPELSAKLHPSRSAALGSNEIMQATSAGVVQVLAY